MAAWVGSHMHVGGTTRCSALSLALLVTRKLIEPGRQPGARLAASQSSMQSRVGCGLCGRPPLTQPQQRAALRPPNGAELEQAASGQGAGQPVGLRPSRRAAGKRDWAVREARVGETCNFLPEWNMLAGRLKHANTSGGVLHRGASHRARAQTRFSHKRDQGQCPLAPFLVSPNRQAVAATAPGRAGRPGQPPP